MFVPDGMRHPDAFRSVPAVVAIPLRDEAERIGDCLLALSRQAGGHPGVVLLVNNTTDASMAAIAEVAAATTMPIHAVQHDFEPGLAHAGSARRMAMAIAAQLAPDGVPLLTTDADGRAAPDWLAANLAHLRRGIDVVFGMALIDPIEAARIPPGLHEADARECAYAAALDEIAHCLDPDPTDPWPRHTEHSGASIALSQSTYHASGGVPALALGEDRAFAQALRLSGARIRHATDVQVVVSGRILGRAEGGMADTIRRRLVAPDRLLDNALEPVIDRIARLLRYRAAREASPDPRSIHAARARIDHEHPMRSVAVANLPVQMEAAARALSRLRSRVRAGRRPALAAV